MDKAAAALARMKGPVVPLNLCFDESGAVDHQAVAAYVDWLSAQGAPILMLTYGSSEFACLDDEDIWAVTETVGQACAGRAFCIGGTGFWKPAKTRDYLAHAQAVGMDAVKVQVHPYLGNTTPVLVNYFDALEGAADIPLLLWAGGQPPFPLEAAVELAQRPHIIGMKNDGDQFYTYYDLIRQTRDLGFGVISGGQMRNFAFGYPLGSPAYLCTVAPFRPDIANAFHNALVNGDAAGAWDLVYRYEEPWLQWAIKHNWLASIKAAIQLKGLYPNHRLGPPNPEPEPGIVEGIKVLFDEIYQGKF